MKHAILTLYRMLIWIVAIVCGEFIVTYIIISRYFIDDWLTVAKVVMSATLLLLLAVTFAVSHKELKTCKECYEYFEDDRKLSKNEYPLLLFNIVVLLTVAVLLQSQWVLVREDNYPGAENIVESSFNGNKLYVSLLVAAPNNKGEEIFLKTSCLAQHGNKDGLCSECETLVLFVYIRSILVGMCNIVMAHVLNTVTRSCMHDTYMKRCRG